MKELDIINMALSKLGQPQITEALYTAAATEPAKSAKLFFPLAQNHILRRHRWSFAIGKVRLVGVCLMGKYRYTLPDDLVRFLELKDARDRDIDVFEKFDSYIETAEPLGFLTLSYVRAVPVDQWDALFSECVVFKLAAFLAGSFCQSTNLEANMLQQLEQVYLPKAQTVDAREDCSNENKPDLLRDGISKSQLLRSRWS